MNHEQEMTSRNIELSGEFSRYLFEHPEMENTIPKDAELILLPEFDKELKEHNIMLGEEIERENGNVVYVSIDKMRSERFSRIEGLHLLSRSPCVAEDQAEYGKK